MGVTTIPWYLGGATRTIPRTAPTTQRPMQGVDPITGVPLPLEVPLNNYPVSELEKASKEGMTITRPDAIPVEKLGGDGNNQRNKKDCKCPASHLCQGKPSFQSRGLRGLEYQLYIANLKSAPLFFSNLGLNESEKSYKVTEWSFNSVNDFDGMWFKPCTLVEAKDKYAKLFDFEWFNNEAELDRFERQMEKHLMAVELSWKNKDAKMQKVQLQWHFSEKETYTHVKNRDGVKVYVRRGLQLKNTPYMTKKDREDLEKKREKEFEENRKRGFAV